MVHISLSIKEDVQLNKTENAWKPRELQDVTVVATATDPTIALYKQVRSVLNKLTYDNFNVLLEQIKQLNIDSMEKLNGVTLLVFDKAIDEPKFSHAYAELCKNLVQNFFPVESGSEKLFKCTLINKCQQEFQKNVCEVQETIEEKLKPIREELAECDGDCRRRNELSAMLIDEERLLRRRTVCTVGFIGELYCMDMLTTRIINCCIQSLLDTRSEEKLECLCKLLTIVGQKLDAQAANTSTDEKNIVDLNEYIRKIQQITDKKMPKMQISNRVKFMLQDVCDLRKNNWQSRRK